MCETMLCLCFSYHIAAGSTEDRILFKKLQFDYAIFDEGHMLKNMSSLRYQSLMKIRVRNICMAEYFPEEVRWCSIENTRV